MKKSTFFNFLKPNNSQDCCLVISENGFKMDFTRQQNPNETSKRNLFKRKKSIASIIYIVMLFLFTNLLTAQQSPACNLSGPLKAKFDKKKGELVTINSEVTDYNKNTKYIWSFKSNTSHAKFASPNGKPSIKVNSGTKGGGYEVELKVINPYDENRTKSCSCTQSISVN